MTYNNFGLTFNDIIEAFNGSVESDFATNSKCGQQIIENEIELKEGELISSLSKSAMSYLNELPSHEVTLQDFSGSPGFYFDFVPNQDRSIYAKIVSKCANLPSECVSNCVDGEAITVAYDSVALKWYATFDSATVSSDQRIFVSYSVDQTALELPSLKSVLRDLVACSLGYQLFSAGNDSWGLVTHYCESAQKWMEKLEGGWIPPEFNSLRLEEYVGGFRAIRYNRLNGDNSYGFR